MKSTAETLGMFRIAFYAAVLAIYVTWDMRPWAFVSTVFWMPVSIFRFLPGPPRDAVLIGILQLVWKFSLLSSAAGLLTRVNTAIAAVLGVYLLGLPQNFGKINHMEGIVAILLCIFAVARCGDAFSLDAALFRPRARAESFEYRWPVRLGQFLFTMVFFAAGVSKLSVSGVEWMTADNLRYWLVQHQYTHSASMALGLFVARSTPLCGVIAVATVVLELSMPLAFFSRRLRLPLLVSLLLLQTGIALTMGVYFTPYLTGYLLFLPWESWSANFRTRSRLTAPEFSDGTRTARPA